MEKIKTENQNKTETQKKICCPIFNPEKYDNKVHNWNKKSFLKESIFTIFHMPIPWTINKKIKSLCNQAKNNNIEYKLEDTLILFEDTSAFKSNIYLSTTNSIPTENNIEISGKFLSKVYDGPYKDTPKFIIQMNEYLKEQNKTAKKYYIHYAYCPKCSKKYSHNYMVLFAEI